jgi:hypothetical protein
MKVMLSSLDLEWLLRLPFLRTVSVSLNPANYQSKGVNSLGAIEAMDIIKRMLHDRMTEEMYAHPITSFESGAVPHPVETIPIMTEGRAALEKINQERGLGFDDFDLDYYTQLFKVCKVKLEIDRYVNFFHIFLRKN